MSDFLNTQTMSNDTENRLVEICANAESGVLSCILHNRMTLYILQNKTPDLLKINRCSCVTGWIEAKEIFLHDIAIAVGCNPSIWSGHEEISKHYANFSHLETASERMLQLCDPNLPNHIGRGVFKRIDENRQLLELLREEFIDQAIGIFWPCIEENIVSVDLLLNSIVSILALCPPVIRISEPYPRPWPGVKDVSIQHLRGQLLQAVPIATQHSAYKEEENMEPRDLTAKWFV